MTAQATAKSAPLTVEGILAKAPPRIVEQATDLKASLFKQIPLLESKTQRQLKLVPKESGGWSPQEKAVIEALVPLWHQEFLGKRNEERRKAQSSDSAADELAFAALTDEQPSYKGDTVKIDQKDLQQIPQNNDPAVNATVKQEPPKKEEKKETPSTSKAAEELLQKYMRRPRN